MTLPSLTRRSIRIKLRQSLRASLLVTATPRHHVPYRSVSRRTQIVGVSCSETAVYNENGLDVPALRQHVAAGKLLKDFPGGTGAERPGT